MKYLVDPLQRYKNEYGDALCPVQNEPDQNFMGEHVLMQPVTAHEFCMFGTTIMSALKSPSATVMCLPIPPVSTVALSTLISCVSTPVPTPYTTTLTSESNYAATSVSNDPGSTNGGKSIPLAGICIPDLPCRHGG